MKKDANVLQGQHLKQALRRIFGVGGVSILAKRLNIKQATLSKYITGDVGMGENFFQRLEECGIARVYVCTGQGSVYAQNEFGAALRKEAEERYVANPRARQARQEAFAGELHNNADAWIGKYPFELLREFIERFYDGDVAAFVAASDYSSIEEVERLMEDFAFFDDYVPARKAGLSLHYLYTGGYSAQILNDTPQGKLLQERLQEQESAVV